jgi:repressor LexA
MFGCFRYLFGVEFGAPNMALTPRQKEIHDFLVRFHRKHDYAPTIAEIQAHFKVNAPSTIHEHLSAIEREGFIERQKNIQRGIKLLQPGVQTDNFELPLLGLVAAGVPIEAILNRETVAVSRELYAPNRFALRVNGSSMQDEHIADGDLIIIEPAQEARNGQTVVALVDKEATVKKFFKEGNKVRLQPANDKFKPIIVEHPRQVEVQGIVVGLIRRYKK